MRRAALSLAFLLLSACSGGAPDSTAPSATPQQTAEAVWSGVGLTVSPPDGWTVESTDSGAVYSAAGDLRFVVAAVDDTLPAADDLISGAPEFTPRGEAETVMVDGRRAVALETAQTIDGQPTVVRRLLVATDQGAIELLLQASEADWDDRVAALEAILATVTFDE